MSDPISPPYIYDGLDPALDRKSTIREVSETFYSAIHRVGRAIDAANRPGMPLSILRNVAREAPLGSLMAAFLLGVAIARRK